MKVIIAGSRGITDYDLVKEAVEDSGFEVTEVVSGGARGVDRLGERWARENDVPIRQFLPDWNGHGKSAGFIRNDLMVKHADAAIILWDGHSRGTKHTLDQSKRKGLKVFLVRTDKVKYSAKFLDSIQHKKSEGPPACGWCGTDLADPDHKKEECTKEYDQFMRDHCDEFGSLRL